MKTGPAGAGLSFPNRYGMLRYMWSRPNPDIFEQWCEASDPGEPALINLDAHLKARRQDPPDEAYSEFSQEVFAAARDLENSRNVILSGASTPRPAFEWDFSNAAVLGRFTPETGSHISSLLIDTVNSVSIRGGLIRSIRVKRFRTPVSLDGCWIGKLSIESGPATLRISGCWIGTLELALASVENLEVKGGSIRSIECPPPDAEKNPLLGSVTFSNVDFPTSRKARLLKGAQGYRNLRAHLEKLENVQAANIIHAAQLATERHNDTKFDWTINWLYRLSSNYGTNPWAPLLWALFLYIVALGAIFFFDGGATREGFFYAGWETSLLDDDRDGKRVRSMILPLQSIINPLGLIGGLKLVVANSGWGQAILAVQGLVTDALLVMTVLAIRKRFRPR